MDSTHRKTITPSIDELTSRTEYKCPQQDCGSLFLKRPNLHMHLVKHHKIKIIQQTTQLKVNYACPIAGCQYNIDSVKGKSFAHMKHIKQHFMRIHAYKRFTCPKCTVRFSVVSEYERHLKTCGDTFNCTACPWKYKSKEALTVHLQRKHPREHKQYLLANKIKQTSKHPDTWKNPYTNDSQPEVFMVISPTGLSTLPTISHWDDAFILQKDDDVDKTTQFVICDGYTQTVSNTVKRNTLSDITKCNAETQTTTSNNKSIKKHIKLDKSTHVQHYFKKSYQTIGTQTAYDKEAHNDEASDSQNIMDIQDVLEEIKDDMIDTSAIEEILYNDFNTTTERQYKKQIGNNSKNPSQYESSKIICLQPTDMLLAGTSTTAHPSTSSMETQTALDELLYSNLTKDNTVDDSSLFSELISFSDIQTQTWAPFNESSDTPINDKNLSVFSTYDYGIDLTSTETQTCMFPYLDEETFRLSPSYFDEENCDFLTTDDKNVINKNKLLNSDMFLSSESQTYPEDILEENISNKQDNLSSTIL